MRSLGRNPAIGPNPHSEESESPGVEKPWLLPAQVPIACAIYARVSTSDQTTEPQVAALMAEAERLGLTVPSERVYIDDGFSGSLAERPAFDRLKAAIEARQVMAVLVTKLDRLGRSVRGVLEFYDSAEVAGVRIVVIDQGMDTATPGGRLMRTILAAMAEFERDLIVDRTKSRMAAFKAGMPTRSGRPVGRPRRVTREKVEEARRLRSTNPPLKWATVAQRVGLPKETLRKAVREAQRSTAAGVAAGTMQ
ncbi:MAG: recombinase family protein [Candidatus Lutacidiplasmatales archaeon]